MVLDKNKVKYFGKLYITEIDMLLHKELKQVCQ